VLDCSFKAKPEAAAPTPDELEIEHYTIEEAEALLAIFQQLDPPGIAARDLRECLLIQLREHKLGDTLTFRLVHDAFDDLIAHRWSDLAKRFGGVGLIQEIIDPSREVAHEYRMFSFIMVDGRVVTGILVDQSAAEVAVLTNLHKTEDITQEIVRLAKSDIEEQVAAQHSPMPSGLVNVLSKQEILDHVWDFAFDGGPNIVEVYVRSLRKKIDLPFDRRAIVTVRGAGYRLDEDGG